MNLRHFNSNILRKRIFVILILLVLVLIYLNNQRARENCFEINFNDELTLPHFRDNKVLIQHKSSSNIFFHETSCNPSGIVLLTPRQACAIESAALLNPSHNVFVLFASQVGFRNQTPLPLVDALLSYPNVHLNYLNITQYAEHTPLANWLKSGALYRSNYFNSHTSDVLRYLSLWKYGGTYLDLDIIMLQSLDDQHPKNYAGAESKNFVAVGIINLEGESGHEIAEMCVQDLIRNFNGRDWGNNGPGVLTRTLHKICGTKKVMDMISKNVCKNFRVLPIEKCYSIRWPEFAKFFKPEFLDETLERLSNSLIAHVWNKFSSTTNLTRESNVAYIHLAKKFCPKTLSTKNLAELSQKNVKCMDKVKEQFAHISINRQVSNYVSIDSNFIHFTQKTSKFYNFKNYVDQLYHLQKS